MKLWHRTEFERTTTNEITTRTAVGVPRIICVTADLQRLKLHWNLLSATRSAIPFDGLFVCFEVLKFDENEEDAGMHALDGCFQFDNHRLDSGSFPIIREFEAERYDDLPGPEVNRKNPIDMHHSRHMPCELRD